jgi:hypothetical protein
VPTDILFVVDGSASMSRDDWRGHASDPQGLRRSALRAIGTLATPRMRLGLINLSDAYSGNNGTDKPTALETGLILGLTDASPQGKAQFMTAVDDLKTTHEANLEDGFTYMSRALDLAGRVIGSSTAPQKYVVVLTDGDVTGEDPRYWWNQARDLQANGVKFVVFRLGRREPPGLTNKELASLNESLAPAGGAARVIDRPEDLLTYYLQTFVVLNRDAYVNALPPMKAGNDQPVLNVQDWQDISEITLFASTAATQGKPVITKLVSDKLGKDVLADLKGQESHDPNLQIVTLSRERLGALEGLWRISLAAPSQDVQVVFRSRVTISPDPLLQPRDAEMAVVSLTTQDGKGPIPRKAVVARGPAGDQPRPLLPGALAPDRWSGVVRPDRDGLYRVRINGEIAAPAGQAPRTDLPPFLEKAFPVATTDKLSVADVTLGFERVTQEKLLKAGQPLQVRTAATGASCTALGLALRIDATYPNPPNGVAPRESAAAQPQGPAPGGGLLYGFVPQGPGTLTFTTDHATLQCPGVELPVGVSAGRGQGSQTFEVDVERMLKVDRESARGLGTLLPGADGVELVIKYDMSSWRTERLALAVQGLPGAVPVTPTIELPAREGAGRPQPRRGTLPVKIKFAGPQPGGAKGSFVLTVQGVDGVGSAEIGRFNFDYEVAAGVLAARLSRDPQISRDGVTLMVGIDPSRLVFLPDAPSQDFDVSVDGLKNARIEPKVIKTAQRKDLFEQPVFVQTTDVCQQSGVFKFKLGLKPLASPNGEILVAGAPIEVAVPLPKMDVTMSVPERMGALRPGAQLPITLQSSSLCPESMRLKVSDPEHPTRFSNSGLSSPSAELKPGDGEARVDQLMPDRPAPRGEGGTLVVEAIKVAGHPSSSYPEPQRIRYYTPLWTEEYPTESKIAFVVVELLATAALALPRTLFTDPIAAHRKGDSSVVSGRKRFRWFVVSFTVSLAFAALAVYWAMARYMP